MHEDRRERLLLPPLGEVLDVLRLIWAVDHQLQSTSKRMEASLGITAQQRFVLRLVGRFPGITVGQLALVLHVHPSAITRVLRRLARRRLVARRRDPRDGRRTFLGLTDAGRAIDADARGTVEGAVRHVLEYTSPAKVAAARELLAELADALERGAGGRLTAPARGLAS